MIDISKQTLLHINPQFWEETFSLNEVEATTPDRETKGISLNHLIGRSSRSSFEKSSHKKANDVCFRPDNNRQSQLGYEVKHEKVKSLNAVAVPNIIIEATDSEKDTTNRLYQPETLRPVKLKFHFVQRVPRLFCVFETANAYNYNF